MKNICLAERAWVMSTVGVSRPTSAAVAAAFHASRPRVLAVAPPPPALAPPPAFSMLPTPAACGDIKSCTCLSNSISMAVNDPEEISPCSTGGGPTDDGGFPPLERGVNPAPGSESSPRGIFTLSLGLQSPLDMRFVVAVDAGDDAIPPPPRATACLLLASLAVVDPGGRPGPRLDGDVAPLLGVEPPPRLRLPPREPPGEGFGFARSSSAFSANERRGGVERRQLKELKGVEVCASGLKARDPGRRETTGEKVLKKRRSPRQRGRTGTNQCDTRTRLLLLLHEDDVAVLHRVVRASADHARDRGPLVPVQRVPLE